MELLPPEEFTMQDEAWMDVAKRASVERDPQKFDLLVEQLLRLLEQRRQAVARPPEKLPPDGRV
jgi:hypothetical protein